MIKVELRNDENWYKVGGQFRTHAQLLIARECAVDLMLRIEKSNTAAVRVIRGAFEQLSDAHDLVGRPELNIRYGLIDVAGCLFRIGFYVETALDGECKGKCVSSFALDVPRPRGSDLLTKADGIAKLKIQQDQLGSLRDLFPLVPLGIEEAAPGWIYRTIAPS